MTRRTATRGSSVPRDALINSRSLRLAFGYDSATGKGTILSENDDGLMSVVSQSGGSRASGAPAIGHGVVIDHED